MLENINWWKIPVPLIGWYEQNKRDLPWRHTQDPYKIWVSEIMLQQTRVEAVKDYYRRFLLQFPTVNALAESDLDQLNKVWQGLGYYSRARNMREAAKSVVALGGFPHTVEGLKKLKGIGDYTASSVASIAFGVPTAAVDGNVLRVVSRIAELEESVDDLHIRRQIRDLLNEVIPTDKAGAFNQAMMELGATVCKPNGKPDCKQCPLLDICESGNNGTWSAFPVRKPKKPRKIEYRSVLLWEKDGKFALRKRPDSGILASLWEFPNYEGQLPVAFSSAEKVLTAKHIFTHVEWHMVGYLYRGNEEDEEFVFADKGQMIEKYAVPSAFRTFYEYIIKNH